MLPSANRLTNFKEIENVKSSGKPENSENLVIITLKNNLKSSRFCFIVSLAVSKQASIRNRVKRALRESVRQELKFIKPGFDVVIISRPSLARKITGDIMKEVKGTLKKTALY